jgi:TadE-like protein
MSPRLPSSAPARPSTHAPPRAQSGQAVVEAAIILPAMVFLLLCALQLTQLQQARIMVEYAAFNAARAGIVHNLDNGTSNGASDGPMRDAAVFSILPTFGLTTSVANIAKAKLAYEAQDAVMRGVGLPQVRVAVLNPHVADFARLGGHLNGQEIDFDDLRPQAAPATLLSIQVRYLYELKVPFANKMVQTIWLASQVGLLQLWRGWDLTSPRLATQAGPDAVGTTGLAALGKGSIADGIPGGLNVSALAALAKTNRFFLPVSAWYTMRMQSNPYRKWAAP